MVMRDALTRNRRQSCPTFQNAGQPETAMPVGVAEFRTDIHLLTPQGNRTGTTLPAHHFRRN